jgi:23S rRNA pseudouridine1911/1915/1917 synthase
MASRETPTRHRLARAVQHLLGVSYSRAKREVETGHVLVDGIVVVDPGAWVADGAGIRHQPGRPRLTRGPRLPALPILHLDTDVIVIDKPAGLVVHPTVEGERDTVIKRALTELAKREPGHHRLHVVHRLDRDTSGVMLLARHHAAARHLQQQLRLHSVTRRYLAIVAGVLAHETRVDRGIGRPTPGSRRAALASGGRSATTLVRPVEPLGTATLVEAELRTGRTHQARVHLSYLGHPVLGDEIYGEPKADPVRVPRLALHATQLGFVHPSSGARLAFTVPLPADLAAVVTELRRRQARRAAHATTAGRPTPRIRPPAAAGAPRPRPRPARAGADGGGERPAVPSTRGSIRRGARRVR